MKKLFFWLCVISLLFSFWTRPNHEGALRDFATKSFELFFRSERAKEIFDLDREEAVAVFGDRMEKTLV